MQILCNVWVIAVYYVEYKQYLLLFTEIYLFRR